MEVRNRFKGLHLIDRVPEELWTEVCDIVQETGIKTILKKKKCKKTKKQNVFIPIPKKGNAKECSNYHTTALISHASKVMLKILQARLQPYVNCELPDVQAGFRKSRGTRDQIANIC